MRLVLAAILVLQLTGGTATDRAPESGELRYERQVLRQEQRSGQTCVVLDATVLAHAGSRSSNDLRLYAGSGANAPEIPFALTESSPLAGEVDTLTAVHAQVRGNAVQLDLRMPDRPYSEIELGVNEKDFIAIAEVTGSEHEGTRGHAMGTETLFDLSGQGLGRSTRLELAESTYPWVHVRLRFQNAQGKMLPQQTGVVAGATVPPSREAQLLYSTAAETRAISANGTSSVAELPIAAHVPIERVRVELEPGYQAEFLRKVTVSARAASGAEAASGEFFEGEIGRVRRPDLGPGVPPIRFERLEVPAALGSNLRSDAMVRVSIANNGEASLPIRAVLLEMRRRNLCFAAAATGYVLRYGDESLRAPAYAYARTFQPDPEAILATLGPEQVNRDFVSRAGQGSWRRRSPEFVWVLLLAGLTLAGAAVLERLRRHQS